MRKGSELPTFLGEIIAGMKAGDVTKPIRTPSGYHIVKLNEIKGSATVIVNQVNARHILIKTNELQDDATVEQKLVAIRDRIVNKGENFAAVASVVRKIRGPRPRAAIWAGATGTFVPEFEKSSPSCSLTRSASRSARNTAGTSSSCWDAASSTTPRTSSASRHSWRCAKPRRTKKLSSGCAGCATRRTSSTSSEDRGHRGRTRRHRPGSVPGAGAGQSSRRPGHHRQPRPARRAGAAAGHGYPAGALPARCRRRCRCWSRARLSICRWAHPSRRAGSNAVNARHVLGLLDRAIDGCVTGEFAAMVTAPSRKASSTTPASRFPATPNTWPRRPHAHRRDAAGGGQPAGGAGHHPPAAEGRAGGHHARPARIRCSILARRRAPQCGASPRRASRSPA